ncbi:MAG: hypothetical protein ACYSW3_19775 [Planctomycetota bacterium]|jgi:chemotaxis signal transduction protein
MYGLVSQIDGQVQTAKSKEGEYLTFTFFEKNDGMELEVAGWTKLRPLPDKPEYIRGDVNPWAATTCFVILQHPELHEDYFGMVVDELSNVINIADGTENKMSPLLLSARRHLSSNPMIKN